MTDEYLMSGVLRMERLLRRAGFDTREKILLATEDDLCAVLGFSDTARAVIRIYRQALL